MGRDRDKKDELPADVIEAVGEGDKALVAEDYATAVKHYTKALSSKKLKGDNRASILTNRGIAYVSLKDCPSAIPDFSEAIEESTEPRASALAGRGDCYAKDGKVAEGLADLKAAVAAAPQEMSYVGALCSAAFNAKIYADAAPSCEAYAAATNNLQVLRGAAQSYEEIGNKAKANELWRKLLAADPGSQPAKEGIARTS